jgi:thiamine biosynthesis lipoprotein
MMHRLEFRAMGCRMMAVLDSESPRAMERLEQVPVWFANWEDRFSRFRESSELSRINRSAGKPIRISDDLWDVVRLSVETARRSGGLVTPSLLTALESAGYDRTFEALDPADSRSRGITPFNHDWREIVFDTRTCSIRLPEHMRLDLGGVAKGWAADRAAKRLAVHGPALVDAGGDVAVRHAPRREQGWPIGVTDPFNPDQQLALLIVPRGGVATSGRDYRRWQQDGAWRHHIIDPRTGFPARTDVLTATVVASTTASAEMAAKAALILGSKAGLKWLEARPSLAGLLVCEDGRVIHTRRLKNYFWRKS